MDAVKKNISKLEATIKRISPDVIVQRAFYDEASGRVFVTLVQGLRKIDFALRARDLNNGSPDRVDQTVRDAIKKLPRMPVG